MLTLASLPWIASLRSPNRVALHSDDGDLDYRSLDRAAAGVAARLARRGIDAGDRVGICSGNDITFPALYYGALRAQAVVALLPPTAPVADLADAIRRLRLRLVASDAEHAARIRAAVRAAGTQAATLANVNLDTLVDHPITDPKPVPPHTPAVILHTSGTTGTPRDALHSHVGLLLNARAVAGEILHLDEHDVQLGGLPMAHSFGMSAVLNASVLAGAAVALLPRFDADAALRTIDEHHVTIVQAVPTMLARLASAAAECPPTLRLCVVSGAPLPAPLAAQVHDRLCPTVVERYGMTEVSPLTMRDVPRDGGVPGDVGRPLWGVAVRVAGNQREGELEASAPSMFLGYAGARRATQEALVDGFFRTGDLGTVADDGRVQLTGRLKDLIIRGGYNVAAREVEHLLEQHPAVAEVSVVGIPDADLGEEVAAALVLRERAADTSRIESELEQRCRDKLAAFKRPRHWYFLDELPRTASGKVRKGEVRDLLAARAQCDST